MLTAVKPTHAELISNRIHFDPFAAAKATGTRLPAVQIPAIQLLGVHTLIASRDVLAAVIKEAYEDPEIVRTAPHNQAIHKVDGSGANDPELVHFVSAFET